MRLPQALAIWLLLCQFLSAQTVTVQSFEAIAAKAVKVEQLTDVVAVILTDRQPGVRTGAYLQVSSPKKWATPLLDGIEITQTKTPGEWILFAPAGKYRLLLAEFDNETGPRYTYHDLVIGKATPEPDEPDEPTDPPSGDYAALTAISKSTADKLNDPSTRKALVSAYTAALSTIAGKPYDDARIAITAARRAALNAREANSLMVDWNSWLKAVDAELAKVVPAGDAAKYAEAIRAIVKGLE